MLRLLYGNDKRNPIRTLDLAESASGHIFLKTGGFAPGSGERNELWSGSSIRFDGQRKLAESRQNTQLVVTYDLYSGSMTGLSELQRKVNQFLNEAKTYHTLMQGEKVWLEYRWSDNLSTLPTPKFGQLGYYYEVYSGNVPKWPDDLHTGALLSGNVEGVALELTCSPYSEGLTQGAGHAYGGVTMVTEGVRVNGADTWLKWLYCTGSGLTTNFTVAGWMTAYWTSASSLLPIFTYRYDAANLVKIEYDGTVSRWTITKIVSSTTYTATSAADTVSTSDDVHLALVQDDTTLRLYVNGVEVASVLATATMTDAGHIGLGCAISDTILAGTGSDVALDGWRIFADDLTATQVSYLYAAELPIKTGGGQVGPPPYVLSTSATYYGSATDGLTRLIGGVGGDVPAETDIVILRNTTTDYFLSYGWLGLKYLDSQVDLTDYLIFTIPALSDQTGTSLSFSSTLLQNLSFSILKGRYRLFARIAIENKTVSITPQYSFYSASSSAPINLQSVSFAGNGAYSGSYELADLGDIFISPPESIDPIDYFYLAVNITAAVSTRIILERFILVPYPYNKIIPTAGTGTNDYWNTPNSPEICVRKNDVTGLIETIPSANFSPFAYVFATKEKDMQRLGPPLLLQPGKHNYLTWTDFTLAEFHSTSRSASLKVFITPRYLLPGGMVA